MKFSIVLSIILSFFLTFNALAKKITESDVPKIVIEQFNSSYPDAIKIKYKSSKKDDISLFQIEFKQKYFDYEIFYTTDGKIYRMDQEIDEDLIPSKVKTVLEARYSKAQITKVIKTLRKYKNMGYKVTLKRRKAKIKVKINSSGKILEENIKN